MHSFVGVTISALLPALGTLGFGPYKVLHSSQERLIASSSSSSKSKQQRTFTSPLHADAEAAASAGAGAGAGARAGAGAEGEGGEAGMEPERARHRRSPSTRVFSCVGAHAEGNRLERPRVYGDWQLIHVLSTQLGIASFTAHLMKEFAVENVMQMLWLDRGLIPPVTHTREGGAQIRFWESVEEYRQQCLETQVRLSVTWAGLGWLACI